MTAPAALETRRERLRRKAAEDLEQLARDGKLPTIDERPSSDPTDRRRDRLRRWREARDAELARDRAREQEHPADRASAFWNATADLEAALTANQRPRDPFFEQQAPDRPVPQRPLGPTARGGVRANDPYREGTPANPSFAQMKNLYDPYMSDSPLYRGLAHARYQGPLNPVAGLGQTTAKVLFRIPDLLHALPWERGGPVGRTIDKGLAAWEQDLGSRIARDEAQEYVVRERHMSPLERVVDDLARFGLEFETAGRIAPFLKASPAPLVASPGAGVATRALTGAARIGRSAALQGAQFGTFEGGRSLILPKFLKVPRREAPR